MWIILWRQFTCTFKQTDYCFQPFHGQITLNASLYIFLKAFGGNNSILHIPNLLNISSALSYSVTLPQRISSIASSMPVFFLSFAGTMTTPFMDCNTFFNPDITERSSTCIVIVFIIFFSLRLMLQIYTLISTPPKLLVFIMQKSPVAEIFFSNWRNIFA